MRRAIESNILRLTVLTALLAGVQTVWEHSNTSNYVHHFFSIYFWIELVILSVILLTGLKGWASWIIVFGLFCFEVVTFLKNEMPLSPDHILMLVVVGIRLIILAKAAVHLCRTGILRST